MHPPSPLLPRFMLAAALGVLLPAGIALAQEESGKAPVTPEPKPAPAAPVAAEPADAAPIELQKPVVLATPPLGLQFLGEDTVRKPDGTLVVFYRSNFVDPVALQTEIKRWLPKGATTEVTGSATTSSPPTPDDLKRFPKSLVVKNVLRIEIAETEWPRIRRVLELIDMPDPQVLVECKIVEIRHGDELRAGVYAKVERPVGDTFFRKLETSFSNPLGEGSNIIEFATEEKFLTFDYVLELAQTGSHTEVHATPSVIATQGETAEILVADREPIVEQTLRSNTVTATTKFEDVGLTLLVQPLFVGRDFVRARVIAELSRVSDFRTVSTSAGFNVVNPVISTRSADTVVTVPDAQTLVIGGLTSDVSLDEKAGLPWLRDLPVIGPLFGSTTKEESKIELVFFITLTIVRPGEARVIVPPSEIERLDDAE